MRIILASVYTTYLKLKDTLALKVLEEFNVPFSPSLECKTIGKLISHEPNDNNQSI